MFPRKNSERRTFRWISYRYSGGLTGIRAIILLPFTGHLPQRYYINKSTFLYMRMALSIKDPEADRLAREVAKATGETLTAAVVQSLRERLARVRRRQGRRLSEEILKIGRRCAALPVQDTRSDEEIIGYDERGLPR